MSQTKANIRGEHAAGASAPGHGVDPWDMEVLKRALRADEELRKSREIFQEEERLDEKSSRQKKRSKGKEPKPYLLMLKEYGFPLNLIYSEAEKIKGKRQGDLCVQRTVRLNARSLKTGDPALRSRLYDVYDDVGKAVYTLLLDSTLPKKNQDVGSAIDTSSSAVNSTPDPLPFGVAIAAPGTGKTRRVIDIFSRLRHVHLRVGLAGSRVSELLHYEYLLNHLFPQGSSIPDGDPTSLLDPSLPTQSHEVWRRLPESIKNSFADDERTFKTRVTDPRAFFLNTLHPAEVDERLTWSGDEEVFNDDGKKKPPPWATDWDDPRLYNPFAVLKFQARQDLCLAGLTNKQLRDRQVCKDCLFVSCRANTHQQERPDKDDSASRLLDGAKLYWGRANVPLLTHAAFRVHSALSPDLNNFEGLVFDEIPEKVVCRMPKICVTPDTHARANWTLDIQAGLRQRLTSLLQADDERRGEAEEICAKMESARSRLAHLGQKLRREALAEKRSSYEFKVETDFEPLLDSKDFDRLVKLTRGAQEVEDDDDADTPGKSLGGELRDLLLTLRDFSGAPGERLSVYLEHTFDKNGGGELWVHRPVNGWSDVLNKPNGMPRPTVVLDASAGLDPRYQLLDPGGDEQVPLRSYPNTTIVFHQDDTEWLGNARGRDQQYRIGLLKGVVRPCLSKLAQATGKDYSALKLLVLTNKGERLELEQAWHRTLAALRAQEPGALPQTMVDHFGRLRGSNDYRDFDAVFFANLFARPGDEYLGLDLLLRNFEGYPRQWESKNVEAWKRNWELTRFRSMVAEIYQDALRIGLRSSPDRPCVILLPTSDQRFVARSMRCFRDATFVLPGEPVPEKLKAGPAAPGRAKGTPPATRAAPADDEPVFGEPQYDYDEPVAWPERAAVRPVPLPSQSEMDLTFGPARFGEAEDDVAEVATSQFVVTDDFRESVVQAARVLARQHRVRLPGDGGRNELERVATQWRRRNPGRSPEALDTMEWADTLVEMWRVAARVGGVHELDLIISYMRQHLAEADKSTTEIDAMLSAVRARFSADAMLTVLNALPWGEFSTTWGRARDAARSILGDVFPDPAVR